MLEIRASRAGALTALKDGISLHSPYDPIRETSRFVRAEIGEQRGGTIVVLGEVLGHISRCAAEHSPGSRVLALFYDGDLATRAGPQPWPAWHPALGITAESFLRSNLDPLDLEGLRVLDWPPTRAAYPAVAQAALEAVSRVVRETNGSITTTIARGRRWLRNSVLNALHAPPSLASIPAGSGGPLVIAGSGPSLQTVLPAIERCRAAISLWALPSAVSCLLAAGLEPDLVVMTDPVYYSVYHLHPAAGRDFAVAMPLSAAPGTWRVTRRVIHLAQPTFYEMALLRLLGDTAPRVSQHGTVAGTALELGLSHGVRSPWPVVMAGLDLCTRDIHDHCRPNSFERFLEPAVGRLAPMYNAVAQRTWSIHPRHVAGTDALTSPALETYAGWFAAGQVSWSGRVRRLAPSPVAVPGMPAMDAAELERLCRAAPAPPRTRDHPPATRRAPIGPAVRGLLSGWIEHLRESSEAERASPQVLAMARELALGDLIEIRALGRRGDTTGARERWAAMTRGVADYLRRIEELVGAEG